MTVDVTSRVVRPLVRDDVVAAGALLGRAFQDNPVYRAIFAHLDDGARARAVGRMKLAFTGAAVRRQEAEGVWVDGELAGVSLVCAPGQYPHSLGVFLRHARGTLGMGWRSIRQLLRADAYMRSRHFRGPHYYLFVLGVEPTRQRQGLGRELLRSLAARVDGHRVSAYLETDRASSVALYRSVGFEVDTAEDVGALPGLHMWTMTRPVNR
jgi:ribosomal protein S18 acetylase RimI-like enzyme